MAPTPVFLISFNRGAMLERTIAGLRLQRRPTEIVVHDNGSTDPDTLATLRALEKQGVIVNYSVAIKSADELNNVDVTINGYFMRHPTVDYIVSDCDIDLNDSAPRSIDIYHELLNMFPDVQCVGPMLRIQDVPRTYTLFNHMMNRHIEQFWKRRPLWVETSVGRTAYIDAPIDTTLALHRAGQPFSRLKRGLRVYAPYDARHLDWYINPGEMEVYANTSGVNISHWNNTAETSAYRNEILEYSSYYAVRQGEDGLEECEVRLKPSGG